jgi:tryptophan-rich sensory protein
MDTYQTLQQPPLSPPGWIFPIVWSILYLLMGYASYRVLESGAPKEEIRNALILYGLQLAANFIWPLLFFGGGWFLAAFLWLIVLWVLIFLTIRAFSQIDETAGNLLIPYILWASFAAYLNFGIYLLNE